MSPNPNFDATTSENLSNVAAKEKALKEEYRALLKNKEIWTDDFTRHELCGYCVIAVLYYYVVRGFYYLGLTTDMIVILACVLTVYDVTVAKWKIKYSERTLKMRKLTQTGAEMIKNTEELSNLFWEEEDKAFLHMADHVDYAVMKYVGDDVPMLVEQEYQHAQLHHEGQAHTAQERQEFLKEMGGFLNGLRKMVLRRTRRFGILICGMMEASNTYGLLFNALCGFRPGTLFQFHIFEEAEHAAITVQNLKSKTTAIERMLTFPMFIAMMGPQIPMLPLGILRLAFKKPALLLDGKFYLRFVENAVLKTLALTGSFASVLLHWVLPVPHFASIHHVVHTVLEKQVRECGLDWEVTKEATYPLYL